MSSLLEILVKKHSFGKVTGSPPTALQKSGIHYWYFLLICPHYRDTSQITDRKRATLRFNTIIYYSVYIIFLFSCCSLYGWPSTKTNMIHLINNTCFWLGSIKKKKKHGTHNVKINVKRYSLNLPMAKQTDVLDSTTCPHSYVIALLLFHITKKHKMYFSLYSLLFPFFFFKLFYRRFHFLSLIFLTCIENF